MTCIGAIMDYISGFGTKCAALTSVLGLSLISVNAGATTTPTPGSTLDVAVSGLRNVKGNVLICVTADSKAFPDCSKDPASRKAIIAADKAARVRFPGMAAGAYAISLIHDENANGKLDTKAMIPGEGFGFSNNPMIMFGPPGFKRAKFVVGEGLTVQAVKMKYML
jgi:uncharacterized protein (DUF2141 family)